MHLILNGDDPMLQKFVLKNNCKVTYYGIDKNKYSYQKSKFENLKGSKRSLFFMNIEFISR